MKYVWNIGDYATWQRQQDKYEDEENSTCDLWMCVSVDERINNTDRWLCVREREFLSFGIGIHRRRIAHIFSLIEIGSEE